MASIKPSVCSATDTALPPGVFITSTPAAVAALHIDIVHAHAGPADHAQLGGLGQNVFVHFYGAAHQQRVRVGQVFRVTFGVRHDDVPAGLRFQQFDARRSERFSDKNFHDE